MWRHNRPLHEPTGVEPIIRSSYMDPWSLSELRYPQSNPNIAFSDDTTDSFGHSYQDLYMAMSSSENTSYDGQHARGLQPSSSSAKPFSITPTPAYADIASSTPFPQASHLAVAPAACQILCLWDGGRCNMHLEKLTAAAVKGHLREHHFEGKWDERRSGLCKWHTKGAPCDRSMMHENFGKHVASVHLHSLERFCQFCGDRFSRIDALARHVRDWCRENPDRP
ncbi:hypothetical protein BKA93DRAFT_788976 [Sparassis latifolia]